MSFNIDNAADKVLIRLALICSKKPNADSIATTAKNVAAKPGNDALLGLGTLINLFGEARRCSVGRSRTKTTE